MNNKIQNTTALNSLSLYEYIRTAVVSHREQNDMNEVILNKLSTNIPRPPPISPPPPTYGPLNSGLYVTLMSVEIVVIIKLDDMINIDRKYNKIILLWLVLYHEKNKKDSHPRKATDVP